MHKMFYMKQRKAVKLSLVIIKVHGKFQYYAGELSI